MPLLIIAIALFALGTLITGVNVYTSFLRYPLHRWRGGNRDDFRWVSGFPLLGSLLLWVAALCLKDRPVLAWSAVVISLFDTGGLHWFAGTMGYMALFGAREAPGDPQHTNVLRPKLAVRILCVVIFITGLVLLSIHLPFGIASHHRVWIVPVFAVFGLLWVADAWTTRIVLRTDRIRLFSISDYQSRTIARADIDGVTWEKGAGASIRLTDGTWVHLPNVGRDPQGLTNTIRAWLKRTEPAK